MSIKIKDPAAFAEACKRPDELRRDAMERIVGAWRTCETAFVRELPPEVSQRSRQRAVDDTLDLQAQERATIQRALDRFRGNRREAAEALNIRALFIDVLSIRAEEIDLFRGSITQFCLHDLAW